MMEGKLFTLVDAKRKKLCDMADTIFDHPELDNEEVLASRLLTDYLQQEGFTVEMGVGGLATAFRAVHQNGAGGPSIGLLCEYDALAEIGHACGHHLQGPAICGAAAALVELALDTPFKIVVYGTPAEEQVGGKIIMAENGCFQDIDAALMFHGNSVTNAVNTALASQNFVVNFHGVNSHAAAAPEKGRSALDALLLTFQGVEFLREHVRDEVRMHYTVVSAGGPPNVVPEAAVGEFCLRAAKTPYLQTVIARFYNIVKGAALMTETTFDIQDSLLFMGDISVPKLDALLLENAVKAGAKRVASPSGGVGSTDFGNVMNLVPGSCISVAYAPEGSSPHTQAYVDAGKSAAAHDAVVVAAKSLAGAALDIVLDPQLLVQIQEEFARKKAEQ